MTALTSAPVRDTLATFARIHLSTPGLPTGSSRAGERIAAMMTDVAASNGLAHTVEVRPRSGVLGRLGGDDVEALFHGPRDAVRATTMTIHDSLIQRFRGWNGFGGLSITSGPYRP